MKFVKDYPVEKLTPADYNPRKITDESFKKLQESLTKFGIVIPLIINEDNILIAGHQRTRAIKSLGFEKAPVYISNDKISVIDEINFNLRHNRVETNHSGVKILKEDIPEGEFCKIAPEEVEVPDKSGALYVMHLGTFLNRYGEFDGIVVDYQNNILCNSDYAYACKLTKNPILCYKLPKGLEYEFKRYTLVDYGEYSYDKLNIKSYYQTLLQPPQRAKMDKLSSRLYDNVVVPYLAKHKSENPSLFDFGAGKLAYVRKLRKEGYDTYGYEPFYRSLKDRDKLNIGATVNMINIMDKKLRKNGLFDIGVCDTVINATINEDFEDCVMTCCNALLRLDGTMFFATRNIGEVTYLNKADSIRSMGTRLDYLDDKNFSVFNAYGVWNILNFHSSKTFYRLAKKYFENVKVKSISNSVLAICDTPIELDIDHVDRCINIEFNMEYPNEYYHNKHESLCEIILELYKKKYA